MDFMARLKTMILSATASSMRRKGSLPYQQHRYLGKATRAVPWYPYGFDANAPPGTAAILLAPTACAEGKVALQASPGGGPNLLPGEACLYSPLGKSYVAARLGGRLELVTPTLSIILDPVAGITLTTPSPAVPLTIVGNVAVTGQLDVAGAAVCSQSLAVGTTLNVTGQSTLSGVTADGKDVGGTHTHAGSATAPTGPVSNTGPPT